MEHGIFGKGSHILTNQRRESTVFSLLIGQNMRPFPENTVLYTVMLNLRRCKGILVSCAQIPRYVIRTEGAISNNNVIN